MDRTEFDKWVLRDELRGRGQRLTGKSSFFLAADLNALNKGLNLGHNSESAKSLTIRPPGAPQVLMLSEAQPEVLSLSPRSNAHAQNRSDFCRITFSSVS